MRWLEITFKPLEVPLLTSEVASRIVEAIREGRKKIKLSLDLGISEETVEISSGSLIISGLELGEDALRRIVKDDRSIYAVWEDDLRKVEIRDRHFYKLVKTAWGHAPTVEIDGIHMHRVVGVSPEEDASSKVGLARGVRGARVLDTCMGLGYTAIAALERGAASVVTVERDENVYRIARINPWSRRLASSIARTVVGDVAEYITSIPDASIDLVIHDPPRLAMAGELYSSGFYSELSRVLRPGGELIHYVGSPGHGRGKRVYVGVMRRLREQGFTATWRDEIGVVYAYKATSRT